MTALILFSHGSVLCGAGRILDEHAERIRRTGRYDLVEAAYLNYSEPRFPEVIEKCASAGADAIVVVPYFLISGKFVRDLHVEVERILADYPRIDIREADPIGCDVRLVDAVLDLAAGARGHESWDEELNLARAVCKQNPRCPIFRAGTCR